MPAPCKRNFLQKRSVNFRKNFCPRSPFLIINRSVKWSIRKNVVKSQNDPFRPSPLIHSIIHNRNFFHSKYLPFVFKTKNKDKTDKVIVKTKFFPENILLAKIKEGTPTTT